MMNFPFKVAAPLCALFLLGMAPLTQAQDEDAPEAGAPAAKATPNLAIRREFLHSFRSAIARNPDAAASLLEEYLKQQQGRRDARLLIDIATEAALMLYRHDRAQPERAIDALDLVVKRFPATRARFFAVKTQAEIFRTSGKPEEGLPLLREAWPQVKNDILDPVMTGVMGESVRTLRALQKPDEAVTLLHEALVTAPPLANWMSYYPMLIETLHDAKRDAEAMQWAALFFRVSPFQEADLQRSTVLVTSGWLKAGEVDKPAAFALAQSQPEAPNPLQEVKAPALPDAVRLALAARVGQEKSATPARISMHLVLGQAREAMLDARELLLKNPKSPASVREVARVFKAADGDVARANAALLFYRDGEGPDPLKTFFAEAPAAPSEVPITPK